jgi:hypothetical protein
MLCQIRLPDHGGAVSGDLQPIQESAGLDPAEVLPYDRDVRVDGDQGHPPGPLPVDQRVPDLPVSLHLDH